MTKTVWIVFDLGFGDAGKGAVTDFLVRDRQVDLVVRFNGGAQAGHNVVTPTGEHHTFSQFSAGMFVAGTQSLLGRSFVLHPAALILEAQRLKALGISDALSRTLIDRRALVISPFQQAAGRLRELRRGDLAHGTCGVGVGEAVGDAVAGHRDTIRAGDLENRDRLASKLKSQQRRKRQELLGNRGSDEPPVDDPRAGLECAVLHDPAVVQRTLDAWQPLLYQCRLVAAEEVDRLLRASTSTLFEGAQGVLLDQDHGFHPHTTWSDCTPRSAERYLQGIDATVIRIGVIRSYMLRHGQGPFPTHDATFDQAFPEVHNTDDGWQGRVRRGPLDLVLLRYALEVCGGADCLAVNGLDRIESGVSVCDCYHMQGAKIRRLIAPAAGDHAALQCLGHWLQDVQPRLEFVARGQLIDTIEQRLGIPVWLGGNGPTANDRQWLCSQDVRNG